MTLNLAAIFGPDVAQINTSSIPIVPENSLIMGEIHATDSSVWAATDTLPKFPDEIDESESLTLRGLCSPNPVDRRLTVGDRDSVASPFPLTKCDSCRSTDYLDVDIHSGQSVRRDCAQCNRTLGFPKWYGRTFDYDRATRITSRKEQWDPVGNV